MRPANANVTVPLGCAYQIISRCVEHHSGAELNELLSDLRLRRCAFGARASAPAAPRARMHTTSPWPVPCHTVLRFATFLHFATHVLFVTFLAISALATGHALDGLDDGRDALTTLATQAKRGADKPTMTMLLAPACLPITLAIRHRACKMSGISLEGRVGRARLG